MRVPKNLTAYRFKPQRGLDDGLQDAFAGRVIRNPGPIEIKTSGFLSPVSADSDILARRVGRCTVFAIAVRSKVIPAGVVSERVAARVRKLSEERGVKVGGRERKRIRDEVLTEMLATAFVKQSATLAWLDVQKGWLVVDTASRTTADTVVGELRKIFDSFRLLPLRSLNLPSMVFAGWLLSKSARAPFDLADECLLSTADGSTWAGKKVDLTSHEIAEHLAAGAYPKRLGLKYNDRLGFVLDDAMVVRRLTLGDAVQEEVNSESGHEDAVAEFDANFTVITAEVAALLDSIAEVFDAELVPDDEPSARRSTGEGDGEAEQDGSGFEDEAEAEADAGVAVD